MRINIDGSGQCSANTPVPFLNHMLDVRSYFEAPCASFLPKEVCTKHCGGTKSAMAQVCALLCTA